ncbi:hypothetical protein G9A89_010934 [Geosiphon pyriformis]|nr:hypothetical protein G9A89_010934 [Geosiphon pyriformis]
MGKLTLVLAAVIASALALFSGSPSASATPILDKRDGKGHDFDNIGNYDGNNNGNWNKGNNNGVDDGNGNGVNNQNRWTGNLDGRVKKSFNKEDSDSGSDSGSDSDHDGHKRKFKKGKFQKKKHQPKKFTPCD